MGNQESDKTSGDVRALILDATEQIMIEEGYAGVSSRKVAAVAGLKSNLLHYYFRTMDDLFIAAFNRIEDRYDERFARAAASERPLHDLWMLGMESISGRLVLEFTALASHRPAIRDLIGRSARRDRSIIAAALDTVFEKYGIDREEHPPKVVAILMAGIARTLSTEKVLGAEDGHDEMLAYVRRQLERFEPAPRRKRRASARRTENSESAGENAHPPESG